jgi:uncharacterized protein YutE (UPF0331/DUF86 family)
MDDVELNKAAIIERCIARVREEYAGNPANLTGNQTKQDAIILNIQRACEAVVDLAMHRVRIHKLGVPQESRQAFDLLARAGKLEPKLAESMKRMVGFRNVAVHDYQALNLVIVQAIIDRHLDDLRSFATLS